MNSNNHSSSCNFSDQLVSYLYGEIDGDEKSRFESHVLNCGVCADEISAFGGVRSSVRNWRDMEFAMLPTPVIELPFEPQKTTDLSTETNEASRPWLAGLRELFSLSPAWAGAATACAALAICAGLFYVAFSSAQNDRNVAEVNKNVSVASVPAPTVDDKNATSVAGTNEKQRVETPKTEIKKDKNQNQPKPVTSAEKTNIAGNANVKHVKTNVVLKPANKEKPANVKKSTKPSDIEFTTREEEDKSLRLADLFDEVSMK
ncbi:MAG TPA: zf-HC2 domain-containing protein [Pyrinomonadaceae bacterium]